MQINRKLNLYEIEDLYHSVMDDRNLRLPTSMSYGGGFGVDASLAQFIISWARRTEKSVLHLYADEDNANEQISKIAKTIAGFSALIMCGEVHTQDHIQIERRMALLAIRSLVEAMFEGDIRSTASDKGARPTAINLFCINNAQREFIKPFYFGQRDSKATLQPKSEFAALIEESSVLMNSRHERGALLQSGLPALGSVLWELISNADQHAVADVNGYKYRRALRGVSIKFNKLNRDDALAYSGTEPELARFLIKHFLKRTERKLGFMEISVIDSGPGLARRWLSSKEKRSVEDLSSLSLDDELKATLECFSKHVTSKDASSASGMGLHNAVQALNKLQAYVRLRTGRLSLHQAFQGSSQVMKFDPSAWHSDRQPAAAEGTVFTICIPVS